MKSVALLTIALFLISAPTPDSADIAEMTANFIVPAQTPGLQAASPSQRDAVDRHIAAQPSSADQQTSADTEGPAPEPEREDKQAEADPPFET